MVNYLWLRQSEKYLGTEDNGLKHVLVKLKPGLVTNTSTPPYGQQFNGSGYLEVIVGSLGEVVDFTVDRQYVPGLGVTNSSYVFNLNFFKDTMTPVTSGATGLTTQTSKNGIIVQATKACGLSALYNWIPAVSGDLEASSVIILDCWGV